MMPDELQEAIERVEALVSGLSRTLDERGHGLSDGYVAQRQADIDALRTLIAAATGLEAGDPDYSPAHQDEYQRLWHRTAQRLRELEDACTEVDAKALRWTADKTDKDRITHYLLPCGPWNRVLSRVPCGPRRADGEPMPDDYYPALDRAEARATQAEAEAARWRVLDRIAGWLYVR